jgi:hypothetical protein
VAALAEVGARGVMAESARVERACPVGQPSLSKRVHYRSASSPAAGRGFEPRCAPSKGAVLPLNEPALKWWARWDLNPQNLRGLNAAPLPFDHSPELVERGGLEPPMFTSWVTGLQPATVAAGSPLRIGPAPRIRTGNIQALDLTPLPVGLAPEAVGGPGRIRTSTARLLRPLHLPVVLQAQTIWRRVQDSNLHATEGVGFRDRGDTNSATTLRAYAYRNERYRRRLDADRGRNIGLATA